MDLAAEQGHNSTLKHGVGCTTVAPLRRPLSQARTSATTRPLAARRWPLSAGTVSRSSGVHRSSAAAQRPPMHRRAAQAFQGIGMVQRQALICPGRASPDQGRAKWASAPVLRGFGEFGNQLGQRHGLQASGRNGTSPPDPEGLVPRFWSPHGGSA